MRTSARDGAPNDGVAGWLAAEVEGEGEVEVEEVSLEKDKKPMRA